MQIGSVIHTNVVHIDFHKIAINFLVDGIDDVYLNWFLRCVDHLHRSFCLIENYAAIDTEVLLHQQAPNISFRSSEIIGIKTTRFSRLLNKYDLYANSHSVALIPPIPSSSVSNINCSESENPWIGTNFSGSLSQYSLITIVYFPNARSANSGKKLEFITDSLSYNTDTDL